jgi:V/A-type H+-transporting ATPase subunit D
MASTTINPTRMELTRLKARRKTAVRGHKLLKDKRDELMRQFLDVVRRNRELRAKVEKSLMEAHSAFTVASAVMSPEMLEQALSCPKQSVSLDMKFRNIMSVNVPEYTFHTKNEDPAEIYPYGFAQTSGELDDALEALSGVFQDMLELAQVEKTMHLLAEEIEKTRRRVNALEYVMIPEMETNIKYISMKLDENERSSTSRLMKVKDMMLEEERQKSEQKRLERENARKAQRQAAE